LQLQAQLAATGYSWGALAALVGGNDLRLWRYQARPGLLAEMTARVAAFWRSIDEGRPPQPDGSDATYRALVDLAGPVDDEPADLRQDNEAPVLAARWLEIDGIVKPLQAERDEIRNRLIEKLGTAKWAMVPGFRVAQAVTPAKPDRPARPDEIIKGRAESRRLIVTQREDAA
jgi:predicted phage-related endonuclease